MIPLLAGLLFGCPDTPAPDGPAIARVDASERCEHGVTASVCPKCNPRLAAVFQAKGDWCPEHGFPESFCPICAPERGGRPEVEDLAADDAPADATRIRFKTRSTASLAGIATATAEQVLWAPTADAWARVVWDARSEAMVSARAAGVVTELGVEVGDDVAQDALLARLRSADVGGDRGAAVAARRSLQIAEAELERKRSTLRAGATSERDLQIAERGVEDARAALGRVQGELALIGVGTGDALQVRAPLDGVVTARFVALGQTVEPGDPLFQVVDTHRVWVEIHVRERDLGEVRNGQETEVTLDAFTDRVFQGALQGLAATLDPTTRTARARLELDNHEGVLRAGMVGVARIRSSDPQVAVRVPEDAVQRVGQVALVFVRAAEDEFIARRVRVLGTEDGFTHVEGGVEPGQQVATTGSFLLKTETLKDSIGAGCCDVE